jgi:hypothetical protein
MANKDAAFGLRPSRMMGGAPYSGGQSRYRIASNLSGKIFQGDLVKQVTGGGIERAAASSTVPVVGVFNGCQYTDAAYPVADLFGNFDIVDNATTGDVKSGRSNLELDVTTGATTTTLPLKAIDISQDPDNDDVASANTNVLVVIQNHIMGVKSAGLA